MPAPYNEISELPHTEVDAEVVRHAWSQLEGSHTWSAKHATLVRRRVAITLLQINSDMARALDTKIVIPASLGLQVFTSRSAACRRFGVNQCLPSRSDMHPAIPQCAEALVFSLRTANQKTLPAMIGLYNRLFPKGTTWEQLLQIGLSDWLTIYRDTLTRPISLAHLRVHLRYIDRLYNQVLHPGDADQSVPIPGDHSLSFHKPQIEDTACHSQNHQLQRVVADIRYQFCNKNPKAPVQGFGVDDVYQLLQAASTNQERLVLLLFLTTGLRIAGLVRLQIPGGMPRSGKACTVEDIPRELVTIEKFNQPRTITLSLCLRVLVARWIKYNRVGNAAADEHAYLFPGRGGHVSTVSMWRVCRGLFRQAGIVTGNPHPHCFRHTCVRMLFLSGAMQLEHIAKWLGHQDAAITSATYCRLGAHELQSLVYNVPFTEHTTESMNTERQKWRKLAEHLRNPFPLPKEDSAGLASPSISDKIAQLEALRTLIDQKLKEFQ
jgi:integrase